jgi:hypothetical protein
MALLESIHLEHLPPSYTLHAALFTSVTNAPFLHQQLLDGNTDFEYALIDASVVSAAQIFPFHIWSREIYFTVLSTVDNYKMNG